ncbi:MAG TPA: flap endonuclease [Gammaproteobacteria bacterium]|nr:flap endonuclease [Gammaproteobacteria bacterium]
MPAFLRLALDENLHALNEVFLVARGKAWLVDSSIYVFKSWFMLPDSILDTQGNPINAVIGFLNFVAKLLENEKPALIGFAFDQSLAQSFRNELYPPYKANRDPAPPELKYQFGLCREFLASAGLAEFSSDRAEADDLIGAWARAARVEGNTVYIITGDKDLTQLVEEDDLWWEYFRGQPLDRHGVRKKHGVHPHQIADMLAIAGDKVDNIPGVPGVGVKTAAKLLNKFGSVENMLSRIPEIGQSRLRGAKRLQGLIEKHRDDIELAQKLTVIDCDTPIDRERGLHRLPPDRAKLDELFDLLRFPEAARQRWMRILTD